MLNLASAILAMFFFVHSQFNIKGIPMPVVIEHGDYYSFDEIYSTITVPDDWQGNCYDQAQLIYYMGKHYNSFLNGNQRKSEAFLLALKKKWVCVE